MARTLFVGSIAAAAIVPAVVSAQEPPLWEQLGTDLYGDAAGDLFGIHVSLSSDGTTLAVSAQNKSDGSTTIGQIRVYRWNTGTSTWDQLGPDFLGAPDKKIGNPVALSADGTNLAFSAGGRVEVREWNAETSTWDQLGPDIETSSSALSMSADGATLAVGSDVANASTGLTRIFRWNTDASTWDQLGDDLDGEAEGDQSGDSVSLSADGTTLAIGAPRNAAGGTLAGHVRVYRWDTDTSTWEQLGADLDGENAFAYFGRSVSLSANGDILAVGEPGHDDDASLNSGRAQVFGWNADTSTWEQLGADVDADVADEEVGSSVALSADGTSLAVGGIGYKSLAGRTRVYEWNADTTTWEQLGDDMIGEAEDDESGAAMSFSADGDIIAIGAYYNDGNGDDAGHVRVYRESTSPSVTDVPAPEGSTIDPAEVQRGRKFKARGKCRDAETVTFTFQAQERAATCNGPAASGLSRPSASEYNGIAEVEFTAPDTPGTYDVVVELGTSLERYVLAVTVVPETTTTTTTAPTGDTLPATGGSNRTTGIAVILLGFGLVATWLGRRTTTH